ncbi:MAG: ester cyclase [Polyangiales bacterium]
MTTEHDDGAPDLAAIWDAHTRYEFETRDPEATLETMVEDNYVNHVPTMTGGSGKEALRRFYSKFFIPCVPPDFETRVISRTVGKDQLVDELFTTFTHTLEIPWLLPGVAPTGKRVEIVVVAIVSFRGDKIIHEHIHWDQASVLAQIGLIDPEGLPVSGAAGARKALDRNLPSNEMIEGW